MRNLSLVLFSLVVLGISAQEVSAQKCKYKIDEIDLMSNERVRRSKMTMEGRDFVVNFYRKADEFRVEMEVALIGERNFVMPEGTELSLKLGNGEIEKYPAAQKATPLSYVSSTQVATNFSATFYCTKEQMGKLAAYGFRVVSIKLGDETLTREVGNDKKFAKTKENATCILSD